MYLTKTFKPSWIGGNPINGSSSVGSQIQFGTVEANAMKYVHTRINRFFLFFLFLLCSFGTYATNYAIWCQESGTLYFVNTDSYSNPPIYKKSGKYKGQTITAVWSGADVTDSGYNYPVWTDAIASDLIKVSFENPMPTINGFYGWFAGCSKLATIDGFNNVSSMRGSMREMFKGCSSLKTIALSNISPNITDMTCMFQGCLNLNTVTLKSTKRDSSCNETVVMNEMFDDCRNLININLDFATMLVTEMNYMFRGCKSLVNIDLGNFNTGRLKKMNGLFKGCNKLSNVDFKGFQTGTVTTMAEMFSGCSALESLSLMGLSTRNVLSMKAMFKNCKKIKKLKLQSFNTSKCKKMNEMFSGCSSLRTIYCNGTWTTETSDNMFKGCDSLVGGKGFKYSDSNVDVNYANSGNSGYFTYEKGCAIVCRYVSTINNHSTNYDYLFFLDSDLPYGISDKYSGKTVIGVWYGEDVTNTDDGVTPWNDFLPNVNKVFFTSSFKRVRPKSLAFWFYGCQSLISIENIGNLNTSEVTNMSNMFNRCQLSSIDVSHFDTRNVKNMSRMFACHPGVDKIYTDSMGEEENSGFDGDGYYDIIPYNSYLTSLDLSNFDTRNVTDMSGMFAGAERLKDLNISSFNTSNVTDMSYMFYVCKNCHPDISTFDTSNVMNMSYMFYNTNPLDISRLDTRKVTDMSYMFAGGYYNLREIDLSMFNTRNVVDMTGMFSWCWSLVSINLSSFDTSNVEYMKNMFYECGSLTVLNLSNFNVGKVRDMTSMFEECTELNTITISDGWNTFNVDSSDNMFYNCKKIVGGDGTTFDSNFTDKTLAYAGQGGYLTDASPINVQDDVPYVVFRNGTLAYYYDNLYEKRTGDVYMGIVRKKNSDVWGAHKSEIKKVVFDESFANARPTSTANWFNGCYNLEEIVGLEYLNTSEVTSMYAMFNGMGKTAAKIKELDLSNFNTTNVTDMAYMFNCCTSLNKIYVSDTWNTGNVETSDMMFNGCKKIVGRDGTTYNSANIDVTVANYGQGGYLSTYMSLAIPYVVYSDNTLTFYCDEESNSRTGTIFTELNRQKSSDQWGAYKTEITNVVIDPSFADYRPTSTAHWFNGFYNLVSITGLEYLNTSEVTDMYGMFNGVGKTSGKITELDLSSFDTSSVTDMKYMFNYCTSLKTIYVSDTWTTDNVEESDNMFYNCKKITGGDGTTYFSTYTDKTRAFVGLGGYLTTKDANIKERLFNDSDTMATDIHNIEDETSTSSKIYNIQGQLVGEDIAPTSLTKGIYIINGKKVSVR